MVDPQIEDRLAATALQLAADIRDDRAQAHRTVRYMSRLELEQMVCILAAAMPLDVSWSELAWWRTLSGPARERVADGRDAA